MAHPGGRPTDYSQETATIICERLAEGESLRSITRDENLPAIRTIYNWFVTHPEFLQQYTKAREDQIDTLADEMLEIADDSTNDFYEKALKNGEVSVIGDNEMVNRARLRVDTRKWIAERMKPRKYGPKSDLNLSGGLDLNCLPKITIGEKKLEFEFDTAAGAGTIGHPTEADPDNN